VIRRLAILVSLALIAAAAAANASFSAASFTSTSTSSVAATASSLANDVLQISAGASQSATVGAPVATLPSVRVTDARNNPVSGVSVTFAVGMGGGSGTGLSAVTNASGIATIGSWILGTTVGANTLTATGAGIGGSPVTFTATATAGPGSKYLVSVSDPHPAAGTSVTLSAQLADQYNNSVAASGRSVTWSKTGSGGTFALNPTVTNVSGVATASFTTTVGAGVTYTVTATTAGVTGTSASFTTDPGPAFSIAMYAGNAQTAAAGSAVAVDPSVRVTDKNNNPVAGVAVTFAVATGGGSGTGLSALTDASGIATVDSWTLGTIKGANTMTATSAGLTGSPVTFTATGIAGAATRFLVTPASSNPTAGVAMTISAQLADQYGNAVTSSGVSVTWSKTGPGGTFAVSPTTTNVNGIATASFTPTTTAGTTHTVTATSAGASGTSGNIVTKAGVATKYIVTSSSYTPAHGTAVTITAQLTDQFGNPVATAGKSVAWTKTGTGGSFAGTPTSTNASGIATAVFTTANVAGRTYVVTATTAGLTASKSPNIVTQ
jgi:adhesin/invasin